MAHRYQGNQQGWSGHRGRGGNFQGQRGRGGSWQPAEHQREGRHRGRGGSWQPAEHQREGSHRGRGGSWQPAEHQRTFDGHGERRHWNQPNSPGPSEFNQDWHQRGSDQNPKYLHVESQREGGQSDGSMNQQSSPFGVGLGNPMVQSPGQANVWQQQQHNANRTSRWPDQNQPLVRNQFAPVHHGGPPHVNEYQGAPQQVQHQQVHPESFATPTSLQPQFSHQQQIPNRSQQHLMENSGSNPMMPSQAFHPSSVPPQGAIPDIHASLNQQEQSPHNQHIPTAEQRSGEVLTQLMLDEKWVAQFVSGLRLESAGSLTDGKATMMPVSEGRQAIRHYLVLLNKLEQLRDSLITCMDSDDVTWQQECNEAKQLKAQLDQAHKKIQDPSFVSSLSEKVSRIKRKRASIGRRKKRHYLAHREEEDRKRQVNEKIDAVLAKEQKAIQDAKNEAALQKEVDSTLFEVRKKKQDADKTVEMLRALRKLRNVRKEAAAQKGANTTSESDRKFEDGVSRLETMMNKARSTYREEEQTLLVMLEEEQEENKERQMEIIRQRQRESALKAVQKRKEILFGKDDPVGPDDPMFPFQQFYSQAESNLPSLMEIRRQWDSFLVSPDDPNGSGIPTDWVVPSEPSSKEWASTLQDT